ncbi:MAG: hypothetical protein ACLP9K_05630 [Nitrososphaerales archaeon]
MSDTERRSALKRLLAVMLFLATSLAFAVLAWNSPVKSLSQLTFPYCGTNPHFAPSCVAFAQANFPTSSPLFHFFWSYQSYAEIAEGFAILALSLPLLTVKKLDFAWLHRPLAPRFPRQLFMALATVGASFFALSAVMDANYYNWVHSSYRGYYLSLLQALRFESSLSLGVTAFGVWGLTVLVLSFRRGIVGGIRIFGLPAILCLMSMLLIFDSGEMTLNVTKFITLSAGGIDLVSNWLVLTVSAGLMGWAVLKGTLI